MINIIIGLMSSGKTLDMVRKLYQDYKKGNTIYCNIPLNFPHYLINADWIVSLSQKKDIDLTNSSIGLDELWIHFDGRNAMSDFNKLGSYFFLQSSKDDTKIYITAQDNRQNEIRLRQNAHRITVCSRVLIKGNEIIPINSEKRYLPDIYNKYLYIKSSEFVRILRGFESDLILDRETYIKASKFFSLYDTSKKVYANGKQ